MGLHLIKKFHKHDDPLFFTMYDYILRIEEERVYSYKVDTYKLFLNGELVDGGFSEKELVKTLYRYYYLLFTEGV